MHFTQRTKSEQKRILPYLCFFVYYSSFLKNYSALIYYPTFKLSIKNYL